MKTSYQQIHPKLPMRSHSITKDFYVHQLGFHTLGDPNFDPYLMLAKDHIEIHFFLFPALNPLENYGMIYIRVQNIEAHYQNVLNLSLSIPILGHLENKPYQQKEFSIIDPDHNLITFGECI